MKKIMEQIQKYFAAAAFAESGEFEAARDLVQEKRAGQRPEVRQERPAARMTAPRLR